MRAKKKVCTTARGGIHYYEIGSGHKNIVFLHGLLGTPKVGLDFAEQLDTKVWRVIVPYLPGHGTSFDPPFGFNFDDFTQSIEEFIQKLEIKNPVMIGHSFGASIIWNMLCRKNIVVNKAIMVAPFSNPKNRSMAELVEAWVQDRSKKWEWVLDSGDSEKHGKKFFRGHVLPAKLADVPRFINLISFVALSDLTTDVPILVVVSLEDKMAPKIDWEKSLKSNAKIIEYPGGHYFYMQNWDKFFKQISDFIYEN